VVKPAKTATAGCASPEL